MGARSGGRAGSFWESLVCQPVRGCADVRRALLDAASLASAELGAAGWHAGGAAPWSIQLLDQYDLRRRRFAGSVGRRARAGRSAAPDANYTLSARPVDGAGVAILALTRPYEGLLLCLPVAIMLVHWAWRGKNRPSAAVLIKRAAVPLALLVAALAWLGYYDYRAFGNPATLPYTVDRAEYAVAPYFVWQQPRQAPQYRHAVMRRFYTEYEMSSYWKIHSLHGFVIQSLLKILEAVLFFAGFALLPPLIDVAPGSARSPHAISGSMHVCSHGWHGD